MLSCFFCDMVFACHLGDCINPAIALRIESICHGQSEIYHETLQGVWCRKCHSGSFVWSQHNYNMLQVDNVNPGSITLAINSWVPPRSSGQWLQKTLPPPLITATGSFAKSWMNNTTGCCFYYSPHRFHTLPLYQHDGSTVRGAAATCLPNISKMSLRAKWTRPLSHIASFFMMFHRGVSMKQTATKFTDFKRNLH